MVGLKPYKIGETITYKYKRCPSVHRTRVYDTTLGTLILIHDMKATRKNTILFIHGNTQAIEI